MTAGGQCIIVRLEWSVADDLRKRRLVRMLKDCTLLAADIVALVGVTAARRERRNSSSTFVAR